MKPMPDFIETITAKMLIAAKRSPWFSDIIDDAKHFESDGYVWDVSLKMSCNYWLSDGVHEFTVKGI